MPRYLGPYDHLQLEAGGRYYRRGENVPASAAQIEVLARGGHQFEGHAAAAGERDLPPAPPADAPPPESYPHDDRGAAIYPKVSKGAADAPKATADKGT